MMIGLTLVAFATSLPEWVASLLAAFRDPSISDFPALSQLVVDTLSLTPPEGQKATDLALGNVIGSNICNIRFGHWICGLLVKEGLKAKADFLQRELPLMIIISSLAWFFSFKGGALHLGKEELILFAAFLAVLIHTVYVISIHQIAKSQIRRRSRGRFGKKKRARRCFQSQAFWFYCWWFNCSSHWIKSFW